MARRGELCPGDLVRAGAGLEGCGVWKSLGKVEWDENPLARFERRDGALVVSLSTGVHPDIGDEALVLLRGVIGWAATNDLQAIDT